MKVSRFIALFFCCMFFCFVQVLQAQISSEQKSIIHQKAKQLLENYHQYINLLGDSENLSFEEREQYIAASFREQFYRANCLLYNDLDPEEKTSKNLPLNTYINYLLLWYNQGVSAKFIGEPRFGNVFRQDGNWYISVFVKKEVRGYYMNRKVQNRQYDLEFRLTFNRSDKGVISEMKIAEIGSGKGSTPAVEDNRAETRTLPNGIKLIKVEGGTFLMGCDEQRDGNCQDNEKPVHSVTLTDFWLSETEITNAQYAAFLNEYGSDMVKKGEHKGQKMIHEDVWGVKKVGNNWQPQSGFENHPVVFVTWYGASEFCRFYGGSLPSEAQWEYAARGQ